MTSLGERTHLSAALVTGACGVMGIAIARRLAQRHMVFLADIDGDAAERTASAFRKEGATALALQCDVTDAASCAAAVERIVATSGALRVLAHVVALSPSMASWDVIFRLNLGGPARVVAAIAGVLAPSAAAVLISSIGGHMVHPSADEMAVLDDPLHPDLVERMVRARGEAPDPTVAYMLAKHGLYRLVRKLAPIWGRKGARINTVSPGFIATAMGALEFEHQPRKRDFMKQMPIARQGSVVEIADAVEFLASDRASYITGTDLLVDGGMSALL